MIERNLYLIQRITAVLLLPMILVHLVLILYAVRDGLTAEEILSRTRGSAVWATYYIGFVAAVSLHAPIGLRSILIEWSSLRPKEASFIAVLIGLIFLSLGLRSVSAVIGGVA